jgi:hypothetical protein
MNATLDWNDPHALPKLGTRLKPYGKLVAIALLSGERYYFFVDSKGDSSMIPAIAIEV